MVLTARRAQIDNSTDEIQNLHGDSSCANRWNEGAEASKSRIIAPTKLTKAHFHFCLEVNIFLLRAMTTSTIGEEQVTGDDNDRGMLSVFASFFQCFTTIPKRILESREISILSKDQKCFYLKYLAAFLFVFQSCIDVKWVVISRAFYIFVYKSDNQR